jgi:transcription antitermination factor NusG
MAERAKWYAVYTKPRWEKKVNSLLLNKGIETYCPLNKVKRKWSDRIKTVEEPLFKSYVFVKINEDAKTQVRMTEGVVNFVYWLGKPAMVRDSEIVAIKKFLDEYEDVIVEQTEIKVNQKVKIDSGVFMDYEADVIGIKKDVATVRIDSLGYKLIARIPVKKLRKS